MPESFQVLLDEWEDPTDWIMQLRRPQLEGTLDGLRGLVADPGFLKARFGGDIDSIDLRAIDSTAALIERLLATPSAKPQLPNYIVRYDDDVLGRYSVRTSEIKLYWVVLGAQAALMNVPVEALTIVVLAHELAHAYTHVGVDMDGHSWDTDKFAGTDLRIIEGLAEYYTCILCTVRYRAKLPQLVDAYQALEARSSDLYMVHRKWERLGPRLGEAIRLAMLTARRLGIQRYEEFHRLLAGAARMMNSQAVLQRPE